MPISTTILAVLGQIELHLTAQASSQADADAALDAAVRELQTALGPSVYSVDGRGLEAVVGDLLREHKLTIAVAESCTGGLLASRLTDVPGSSDYVDRGVVCYSNRAKIELAGVPEALIARARRGQRAGRAGDGRGHSIARRHQRRRRHHRDRGPGGGTPEKPVGTVAIAVVADDEVRVRTFQFIGGREMVKFQAAQSALNMMRLMVLRQPGWREWSERK